MSTTKVESYRKISSDGEENVDQVEDLEDEFEDAMENIPITTEVNLQNAIEESQKAITYFFNNQFEEAKSLMAPYASVSMYHSLGHAVFLFLEAILTFEHNAIVTALKALKHSVAICNRFRKKNTIGESIGKMVRKQNYEQYTEEEAHAELCYAEGLLLRSLLTFMEDETLSSFIKAGLKIRSCHNTYKDCQQILIKRTWDKNSTKVHFEGGVNMGIGTFNLMISLLPSRVIKLLEFIGFSGNRDIGLEDLKQGYNNGGLRQILCMMTLLGYNLVVLHVLSHREGDTKLCDEILNAQLDKHPNGVWFLFFKGRLELVKGNLNESRNYYIKSWKSQNVWPQFHHICFWELLWVHCLKGEWREALTFISELQEKSNWSKSLYNYQKAAVLYMIKDELTPAEYDELINLMKDVPKCRQRIAGKSLPMEKFAAKRSQRFFSQNQTLILPIVELMFVWNLFKLLKNYNVANTIYKWIEKELVRLNSKTESSKYDTDNKALVLLLQGACLRHMGSPLQALEKLEVVISMHKDLVEDMFVVPYAIVELALIEWENGNKQKAILALEDVKKNYSGYSLESRLHFKIHTALTEFKEQTKI